MTFKLFPIVGTVLILTCGNLFSSESIESDLGGFETIEKATNSISDDLSGFDEVAVTEQSLQTKPEDNIFTLSGNLAFKTSAGYKEHEVDKIEYSGVNQAQVSLYLQLDGRLSDNWKMRISADGYYDAVYDIYSNNNYKDDILDEYKTDLKLDDTYIQGKINSNLDIKIGRQVVVWGKSDNIRITDVINPLDNRLLGMTDIEDLRLSVGMAKLDYYKDEWNFSFMAIGESRIMLEAPARSEYYPVEAIFTSAPNPFLELRQPNSSLSDMQYAVAANGVFSGWDLSFYGAHVLDQKWHFDHVQGSVALGDITRVVNRVNMLGSAINIASGNWLFKSEVAYLSGVGYNTTADEKNRADILLGFDYSGFKDAVISVEVANRHIFNYEKVMSAQSDYVEKDEIQSAIRVTKSFSNETVDLSALVSMFGSSWENGGFARIWVDYDIADALSANFGIVDYIGGDKPLMEATKNNDRVFADITYSF